MSSKISNVKDMQQQQSQLTAHVYKNYFKSISYIDILYWTYLSNGRAFVMSVINLQSVRRRMI